MNVRILTLALFYALTMYASGCAAPTTPDVAAVDEVTLTANIEAQHASLHQAIAAAGPAHNDESRYPVVLVHGMAGFRPVVAWFDYFYRVREILASRGQAVYAAQTDPFNGVAYRGRQLAAQVDEVLRQTGAPKVHLIAHSQGGLDARYLIASLGYGDRVATLTTVATPHHGVKLVDAALQVTPSNIAGLAQVVDYLSDTFFGGHADVMAQLGDLSQDYLENTFNPQNPDDDRVAYYSYSGITQNHWLVDIRHIDVVNPLLYPLYKLVHSLEGDNDGLVSVRSAQWGTYLGAFAADHWDEIGQPMKTFALPFDHLRFYCGLATFLNGGDPPLF